LVFILLQVCPDIKLEIGVSACGTEKGEGRNARQARWRREKGETRGKLAGERRREKRPQAGWRKEVGSRRSGGGGQERLRRGEGRREKGEAPASGLEKGGERLRRGERRREKRPQAGWRREGSAFGAEKGEGRSGSGAAWRRKSEVSGACGGVRFLF